MNVASGGLKSKLSSELCLPYLYDRHQPTQGEEEESAAGQGGGVPNNATHFFRSQKRYEMTMDEVMRKIIAAFIDTPDHGSQPL